MSITESSIPYVRLGKSGLKVSKIILGCMSYGHPDWAGWVLEEEEGIKQIKAAYDLGINTFDTANVYSAGVSEIILGKAIKQHNLPRDEIVVMTKVYATVGRTPADTGAGWNDDDFERNRYTNQRGLSRKLDYVDVLQCKSCIDGLDETSTNGRAFCAAGHRFDKDTPVEETMQALHDVVKAGYVRYIGMSSCYAWQFHKMQAYARQYNLTEFISMQNLHNAIYREEEREMVPLLQDMGVGMIPWSPLARGFLCRSLKEETHRAGTDPWMFVNGDPEKDAWLGDINERVAEIAQKRGITMAQVALAWSLSKPFVTAPIVGTTSIEKLKDLVAGVHVKLTEEEIKSIDEPYRARAITGH
ncbi:hypothetical protein FS837_003525 [Tulasnella sp. UAMH 9824]|nr:hypothetical protein FS837_003525 [Tulasnella sp. UAMH 9824]